MDIEKLYDFLTSAGKPMTIGQIHTQPEFRAFTRQEVARGLQQLASENIAFRSVREGKAYYSANPSEGVSRNPCQQNIYHIAAAMNQALNRVQNPEMSAMGKLFDALGQNEEAQEAPDMDVIPFTYHDGRVAECGNYTIAIPDGFGLEMGKENRDFMAWYPQSAAGDPEEARIVLFAGALNSQPGSSLAPCQVCPEVYAALIKASQWAIKTQMDRILGVNDLVEIPMTGQVSGSYLYSNNNYQIMLGLPEGIKQMRVLINDPVSGWKPYHQAVVDWIATIKPHSAFAKPEVLDSDCYLPLTRETLERWTEAVDSSFSRISAIQNLTIQARIKQFEYERQNGTESATLLRKDIRAIAQNALPSVEAVCEEIAAFLKRARGADPYCRLLLEVHKTAGECQKHLDLQFNLDNSPIHVVSSRIDELKAAIDLPEIAALKEEIRKEEEEKKREAERLEAERREAERKREEYRTALENMTSDSENTVNTVISILEALGDYEEAPQKLIECRKRLETIRREKEIARLEAERQAEKRRRAEEEARRKAEEERIAAEKAEAERRAAEEAAARERAEQRRLKRQRFLKKLKKVLIILTVIALLLAILAALTPTVILPAIERANDYKSAQTLLQQERFEEAEAMFSRLGDYKDSAVMVQESHYRKAESLLEVQAYPEAIATWLELGGYSDSADRAQQAEFQWRDPDYQEATKLMEQQEYIAASQLFASLEGYRDSAAKAQECLELKTEADYQSAVQAAAEGKYTEAMAIYEELGDYKDSKTLYLKAAYDYGCLLAEEGNYEKAISYLTKASGYEDANDRKTDAIYRHGCRLLENGQYKAAVEQFEKCRNYEDSAKNLLKAKYEYAKQHLNREDKTTQTYLSDLVAAKYEGAEKLQDELYAWKAEVIGFSNSAYSNMTQNSISKYSTMYAHFKVTGGKPGETTSVKAVLRAPNGQSGTIPFYGCSDGNTYYVNFWYDNPYYGATGTMSLQVYAESGKLLASGSVSVIG